MKPFWPVARQHRNSEHLPGKKKIRAAHAKEKQQIQETCNYPNRLNLLIWTVLGGRRSNYLRFSHVSQDVRGKPLAESMPDCSSDGRTSATGGGSYNANCAWLPAVNFAASSFASCSSDLNSHFSSSVIR